jgi:hypothetical protein
MGVCICKNNQQMVDCQLHSKQTPTHQESQSKKSFKKSKKDVPEFETEQCDCSNCNCDNHKECDCTDCECESCDC